MPAESYRNQNVDDKHYGADQGPSDDQTSEALEIDAVENMPAQLDPLKSSARPRVRQFPLVRRGALAFAATTLIWLANEFSGFGAAFTCFGLRCSRLLRFCPLAIAEGPFHEGSSTPNKRNTGGFEDILRRHPVVSFVVAPDPILGGVVLWR